MAFAMSWPKLSRRAHLLLVSTGTLLVLWFCATKFRESGTWRKPAVVPEPDPIPEPPRFEIFGLRDFRADVEINTLTIHSTESDEKAIPLQQKLPVAFPSFSTFHLDSPEFNESNTIENHVLKTAASNTVSLKVAKKQKQPDASHLTFGVATTLGRLEEGLRGFRHWAADTNVRFVIIVEPLDREKEPNAPTIPEALDMFSKAGIPHLTLVESTTGFVDRYVELIGVLYKHLEPDKTTWVSFIDDDTFFFRMSTLLKRLSKYDTNEPYYVGQLSENKWNINEGPIAAIGGAGVFLTVPLLRQLAPHADECFKQNLGGAGDMRLATCIYTYTSTKLSVEHGLYQLDLHGDVTGFYEAPRPQPISVHHWKSWHHHDMPSVAAISSVCGQACVLQHFEFVDGWQMTNGFSIIKHSYNETELAEQIDGAMEYTWKITIWTIPDSWTYSLAPLKPKDEGKVQFLMERVEQEGNKTILYYVRRRDGLGDGLIRVIWSK